MNMIYSVVARASRRAASTVLSTLGLFSAESEWRHRHECRCCAWGRAPHRCQDLSLTYQALQLGSGSHDGFIALWASRDAADFHAGLVFEEPQIGTSFGGEIVEA
jgi:hypothetical protein